MPEIRVTEEQKRRLDELREELAAAYVDGYGHVRPRDAVEYLLDTYTPPDGAEAGGSAPASPAGTGDAPDDTPGGDAPAGTTADADADTDADVDVDVDAAADALDAGGLSAAADEGAGDGPDATTVVTDDGDETLAAGDSRVADSLSLLDDHEDKWRSVESGEAPYEVDLPDGSTEPARTKDDVRRLLFTHY